MTSPKRAHTDREYEQQLSNLRERVLLMGAKVEEMIQNSVKALVERDSDLAHRMIDADALVNKMEVESDELCLRILARRQPVASDLRFITIALKLVTDLERIGDMAVNICERVLELNNEPPLKRYVDLAQMAEAAQRMVREALDAFVAGDSEAAQRVLEQDRVVDAYYGQMFRELLTYMMEDPRNIYRATRVQAIAKYLERIGDHATNLAEMVVFMVKGQDIRHTGRAGEEKAKRLPHGVLFLCPTNSARSQMAEGFASKLFPTGVKVWSAGAQPGGKVDRYAVRVMQEVGVDISAQKPKLLADVPMGDIELVITLSAEDVLAQLPGKLRHDRWALPDPEAATGSEAEIEGEYRKVRDDLQRRITALALAR
ncbi:MAG TPA: phosphate signaling complex protein PhoU [Myxococcales bacterium]|nr:phosphate signaling complex protein PhoU [Myxococcales bacterium]